MSAAWEWRGFGPWRPGFHPEDELRRLAAALGVQPDVSAGHERDTYLLVPGVLHNLKLRRNSLEVKLFRQATVDGFSLWEDKQTFSFPLAGQAPLWSWLGLPDPGLAVVDSTHLAALLRSRDTGLCELFLTKERWRLDAGLARLELAHLTMDHVGEWFSVCADGYHAGAVAQVVRLSGYGPGLRLLSYVEFLWDLVGSHTR